MNGFETGWLTLREPADRRARDGGLLAAAAALGEARTGAILDLGSGTGSTFRCLDPLLGEGRAWRLVDHDPHLLAEAGRRCGPRATLVPMDLAAVDAAVFDAAALVTASALLDLVSEAFLQRLAGDLARRRLPFYAALTVDGRIAWDAPHPDDARIVDAFQLHQSGEKGLGAALGHRAAERCAAILRGEGFSVLTAPSDWLLGEGDEALQAAFLEGFAGAVRETGAVDPASIAGWLAFRLSASRRGSPCRVGHLDLVAEPGPI